MHTDPDLVQEVTAQALRAWPLPLPEAEGDKEDRGHVWIVAGSNEMPGAAVLAGIAALRAGAGKLTLVTAASVAAVVAAAVPEARVLGLRESEEGGMDAGDVKRIAADIAGASALLIGPGMRDEAATRALVEALTTACGKAVPTVLDALAMCAAPEVGGRCNMALTPHAGEMARLTNASKTEVAGDALAHARRAAAAWNAVVALKGRSTVIAAPDGAVWRHDGGNVGLATSGSGDTLAGVIVGLVARGAPLAQACVWGVALHARAGVRLASRHGPLGYLAREIAAEIPKLMHELSGVRRPA